jgi:hypothetical protein
MSEPRHRRRRENEKSRRKECKKFKRQKYGTESVLSATVMSLAIRFFSSFIQTEHYSYCSNSRDPISHIFKYTYTSMYHCSRTQPIDNDVNKNRRE